VVKASERAHGIEGGIEHPFRPLRSARILEGNDSQSGSLQDRREFFHWRIGCSGRFKGADPKVAVKLKSGMAAANQVRRHCGASGHYRRRYGFQAATEGTCPSRQLPRQRSIEWGRFP